jgi:predicted naringenin-chalcone synthase
MYLTSFRLLRPRFEARQDDVLPWLAEIHSHAEATKMRRSGTAFDEGAFRQRMQRLVRHVCCPSDRIARRGYSASDPEHTEPGAEATALYDVSADPSGAGTAARTDLFAREVEDAFTRLYATEDEPPRDLLHVTCTGYVSPSGAQRVVGRKGWGDRTRVTHAYHMGCYAAVPAVRLAAALARESGERVDVVHTELCSLHFDPATHTPEQLVVQSLFGDGTARYVVTAELGGAPGFELLAVVERIAGGSEDAMRWALGDHGMRMTLSREIPERLASSIGAFARDLFAAGGLDLAVDARRAVFAVHPGGPKIIDVVRDALRLEEHQVAASRAVLARYGNMSSATVPYIWSDLLASDDVPPGTPIASVAFGPGLTLAGALLRKV